MNITIKIIDNKTYQILVAESDDHKAHEKTTWTQAGNSLEIVGKHDGNALTMRVRSATIAAMVIDEGEQYGTITLHTEMMSISIKYAYYKMGNLSKEINHKFKEDVALFEGILAQ
jgi:hypothetical protein